MEGEVLVVFPGCIPENNGGFGFSRNTPTYSLPSLKVIKD